MTRQDISEVIASEKLVVVIRLQDQKDVAGVIRSLIEGGIKVLEVTSNTPGFEEEITNARKLYPEVLIGAGTVINNEIANLAIKAGAQFLVTPNTSKRVIEVAHNNNVPVLMGALTPTEVCDAAEAGADFVKLFPADIMGVPYFKSIKAPLSHTKLLAVGGIDLEMVKDWFEAEVAGIGIAGALTATVSSNEDLLAVKERAAQFVAEVKKYG